MYQVSVLLVLNFRGISILGLEHQPTEHAIKVKNTLIFNAFVICQVSYYLSPFISAKSLFMSEKVMTWDIMMLNSFCNLRSYVVGCYHYCFLSYFVNDENFQTADLQ